MNGEYILGAHLWAGSWITKGLQVGEDWHVFESVAMHDTRGSGNMGSTTVFILHLTFGFGSVFRLHGQFGGTCPQE